MVCPLPVISVWHRWTFAISSETPFMTIMQLRQTEFGICAGFFFADSVRNVIFELNQLDLSMRRKKDWWHNFSLRILIPTNLSHDPTLRTTRLSTVGRKYKSA